MTFPPHPGPGIRDDIEALGLSIAEAAEGMGITRQQPYNLVNGKSGITPEMAVRLEKAVGSSADQWMLFQTAHELAKVRQRDFGIERLAAKTA